MATKSENERLAVVEQELKSVSKQSTETAKKVSDIQLDTAVMKEAIPRIEEAVTRLADGTDERLKQKANKSDINRVWLVLGGVISLITAVTAAVWKGVIGG